jgi:hypothetical protein
MTIDERRREFVELIARMTLPDETEGGWAPDDAYIMLQMLISEAREFINPAFEHDLSDCADMPGLPQCAPGQDPVLASIEQEGGQGPVCAKCREVIHSMNHVITAKDGALFHGRCWNNS